jgi:hypothetical protein
VILLVLIVTVVLTIMKLPDMMEVRALSVEAVVG